jgi:hypothetical protein
MPRSTREHHHTGGAAALALVVLLAACCLVAAGAVTASAARGGGSVVALIRDASDGVVDGTYSIATVRSALNLVRTDPSYMQYSDIDGVLSDYLASLSHTTRPTPSPADPGSSGTSSGGASGGSSGGATDATSGGASASGGHTATPKATAGPASPGAASSPSAVTSPVGAAPLPEATTGSQAGRRLAAAPWFFAAGATVIVLAIVFVSWRHRRLLSRR